MSVGLISLGRTGYTIIIIVITPASLRKLQQRVQSSLTLTAVGRVSSLSRLIPGDEEYRSTLTVTVGQQVPVMGCITLLTNATLYLTRFSSTRKKATQATV